jgi:hypothetical protein
LTWVFVADADAKVDGKVEASVRPKESPVLGAVANPTMNFGAERIIG